ncbi:type VI secretion protein VasK [Burkholderia stagnalis]|uniref:Type VI secretion protein VasK n=1 Tax=Burkholderia stagnalis TaxID=1503054 RepID=A0A6L3N3Y7_9BURK|nr:ImcF-related family protein [Burkholderia stagnalis]KAB0640108.1 type VI secretion protein VasK [Burkholderia stagnalis]KVO39949.1 type VI secretion protein VasK [Burkholderia stagnalis]KVO64496.1 type VI secretion protein VasK [Burkholderia stagnalis]KVW54391.1 type VI secretion protein VasK [Burkholderia stagnalis]KVW78148.1 type VI secretion protein VasK [Burkholderia stagnalis]
MNDNKNDNKTRPAGLFIGVAAVIVFLALGIAVWVEGPRYEWSRDTRIIIELSLFSALLVVLLLVKHFELVLLWIASLRASRWFASYDAGKRAASNLDEPAGQVDHATALRNVLRDRHGWRWRYRERWVLIASDEPLVKRLAPGLADAGYAITGDAVLLHAKQTSSTLDTEWLDQIRRLRRRRPIDAIVAVTRNRSSGKPSFDSDGLAERLARHARALRWAAPAYLLNVTDFGGESSGADEATGFTWSNVQVNADDIDKSLQALSGNLADAGVVRLVNNARDRYPAELSQHIANLRGALSDLVLQTTQSRIWKHAVHGLLFAPLFKERELAPPSSGETSDDDTPLAPQHRTIWQTVAEHSRKVHGRRIGFSLSTTAAWATTALIGCWMAGTMLSGFVNRGTIESAADTVATLFAVQDRTQAMQALDGLDRQIDTLEIHRRDGAPWASRFGLNRDDALLDALWPGYAIAAKRILITPIREKLEQRLHQLASLSDAEIASGGNAQVQAAYDTLKAYMMLAKPERAVAAFLMPQFAATATPARSTNSPLSSGAWDDLRQHTIAFFANHLAQGKLPAITPDLGLVASTRQTVIGVRGIQNSTDAVYQQILDEATPKYPPVSLATLLGDTTSRGLFTTTVTVPGVFTRAAWDERISKAIDEASGQHSVAADWVLSDAKTGNQAPSTLKAELRQRYFDDYARAWAQFLNSLRWQQAPTLSATADQLTLLGDSQRSPLVALMNVIAYQAGTGTTAQSLSDTLISKAQQLVGADEKDPSKQAQRQLVPLAAAFGPILRLIGSDVASSMPATGKAAAQFAATGDLSLARYLERVTAMRLKASQIVSNADPDAMARLAAQSVLQGKTSDIADSRDYASRLAASLGEQWSGFGELFRAPFDQAWQVVVRPAASSLNEIWRTAIAADWNRTFAGRYPFADSDNDASLPEMARFMQPDNGVITQFVTTQLAGVIERQGDRWVVAQGANQGALTIDPAFLNGLNKLTRISTVLFPAGDARVRYELQAVQTPGVTDMKFVLSGRELHYFNQKQAWVPFEWPGQSLENLSHIEWRTEQGGLRTALDSQGRFGLIRLLERAKVSQQDNARYLLTWTPDTSQGIPLKVQLRSEAGGGPLDVLQLRNFALPAQVFVTAAANGGPKVSAINPPPLPPSAIASAQHAAVPLPSGLPDGLAVSDNVRSAAAAKTTDQPTVRGIAADAPSFMKAQPRATSAMTTISASAEPLSTPFGHALRLSGDVFVY